MDTTHVDVIPAREGVALSFVESQWHRISARLECERAIDRLAGMLDREPCWDDLHVLASLRSVELDQTGRLMRLMATRRVSSFLDGQTVRDIVDLADVDGDGEAVEAMDARTTRHEIGLAFGRTKDQAEFLIGTYRRLVEDFPDFVSALTAGQISLGHCYAMHEETLVVTDPAVLAKIAGKALPFAQAHSVTRFRTALKRLIQRHDPNAAARRRQARLQRRVSYSNLGDGISSMTVVARTEDVEAMRESIDDAAMSLVAADRAQAQADADADAAADGDRDEGSRPAAKPERPRLSTAQARSGAVVAALLGTVDEDGTVTYAPREHRRTRVELVIDAPTAAGIADNLARFGQDPICAGIARRLMVDVDVIARALVAEGTAHLLDLGQDTYLSAKQRTHIKKRDRATCRCCGRRATRGEMDHLIEFLRGGPSAPWNEWWLCLECHQRKTAEQLTVDGRTDAAVQITTPHGVVYYSSPPPYLDDPDRDSILAAQAPPARFTLPGYRHRRPAPTVPDPRDDIPPF